jgi:hypothetical protein
VTHTTHKRVVFQSNILRGISRGQFSLELESFERDKIHDCWFDLKPRLEKRKDSAKGRVHLRIYYSTVRVCVVSNSSSWNGLQCM